MDGIAFFMPVKAFAHLKAILSLNPLVAQITGIFLELLKQGLLYIKPDFLSRIHDKI